MRNEITASRRYNKRDIALIHRRDERKRGSKKKKEKIIIDLSGKTRDPRKRGYEKGRRTLSTGESKSRTSFVESAQSA
jgi:hypothetical protein